MDPLLRDLKTRGVLDDAAADWATAHQARTRSTLDSALLELDLIDEDSLLGALGVRFDLPAAEPGDLDTVDPEAALQFSAATSRSFGMCPVFVRGGKLVAFVASPLPTEQRQQLRDSYALEIEQLVVPVHYLALAWDQAYGIPVDERTHELEIRLERRRSALGVREVLEKVASASRLSAAVDCVLDFAACLVEASGFLVYREDELRVAQTRGSSLVPGTPVPLAESGCTLGAAIRHGGYFFGPLIGTEADRSFYKALERTLPQRAFVAPVPITKGISVVFCADNGPRGIASRWAAELTVLVSRLGWEPGDWEARWRGRSWSEATHEKAPEEPTQEESESEPSPVERQAADALGAAGFVSKEVPERSEESAPAPPVEASEQPSTPTTLEEPGVDPPRELDEAPATNLTPAQTAVEQAVLDRLK